jgi:GTP-binding protein LepA
MMLNGEPVEALSTIVHRSKAQSTGRDLALKLKNVLHRFATSYFNVFTIVRRQMYQVAIQAAVDGRVVARETYEYRFNFSFAC